MNYCDFANALPPDSDNPNKHYHDRLYGFPVTDNNELFGEVSWFQVMFGQGIRPQGYHGLVDARPEALVANMLADVKRVMHGVVDMMPTHEAFIAANCPAPPMA